MNRKKVITRVLRGIVGDIRARLASAQYINISPPYLYKIENFFTH